MLFLSLPGLRTLHEAGPELKRAISGNLDEMRDDDIPTHRVRVFRHAFFPLCLTIMPLWVCSCRLWGIAKKLLFFNIWKFVTFCFPWLICSSLTDLFLSVASPRSVCYGKWISWEDNFGDLHIAMWSVSHKSCYYKYNISSHSMCTFNRKLRRQVF